MPFTFDSPISASYTAADKANKQRPRGIPLPPPKTKRRSISSSLANIRNSFGRSSSVSSPTSPSSVPNFIPASESQFFHLPLPIRRKIYAYVLGKNEVFHVLLKRKVSKGYFIGHRRCRAGGNRDDCIVTNCKQFCNVLNGFYFGYFDSCSALLLSCRDIHKEASQVLYGLNTFDFDHPLAFLLFTSQISPSSLQSITAISLDLGKYLYDPKSGIRCKSLTHSQWTECWEAIAKMEGVEEIRVRFRNPVEGWMGWSEQEVLRPLWKVGREMRVFEVEASTDVKTAFDDDEQENVAPFTLVRDVQFPRR